MSDEHEYICEIWVGTKQGGWLPAEDSTWGSRDAAIDTAEAWDEEGWTCRITSRPSSFSDRHYEGVRP